MILIFGGTTEGRKAVGVIDKAGKPFYYSTKGDWQEVSSLHGIRLSGAMDADAMIQCCKDNNIRLLIDAAHPFAEQLHQTIADVSERVQIPVVRYERIYPSRDPGFIWCEDYADAITQLYKKKVTRLLALTGVQTIGKLKPFWMQNETYFRILNREDSLDIAHKQGFPEDKLLYYQTVNDDSALIGTLKPDAIILKESGTSGGFTEKVAAAKENKVKVFVVKHPAMPDDFYTVNGEHGLRRAIEQFLPDFFPLRTGVTTGSCATAAAVAALNFLVTGKEQNTASILLPNGEMITIPVKEVSRIGHTSTATVIKDSGDDADITNGTAITVTIKAICSSLVPISDWLVSTHNSPPFRGGVPEGRGGESPEPQITIRAGHGVGTVTLPGLGLPIGGPAINTGPQQMIRKNIQHTLSVLGIDTSMSFDICISVPDGEKMALRTFNPRLGVVGGISIIGTSGIVQPFSIEAFISSIHKSMEVARASNSPHVVINSGAKSEKYLRNYYPNLPDAAFVHYGNYIGETLQIAAELNIHCVTLGIMIGKAVKLAEGYLDTHSKKITMNKEFLTQLARETRCSNETIAAIGNITLARELWTIIPVEESLRYFSAILSLCYTHCTPLFPKEELTILLIKEDGEIFNCTDKTNIENITKNK